MKNYMHPVLMMLILLGITISLPLNEAVAQRRRMERREIRREVRREYVIASLPREHERILVRGKEYFYARGVFYRSSPRGFVVVAAPIGARVKVLPGGYTSITVGVGPLFFHYGTYFRYDPAAQNYVIVNQAGSDTVAAAQTFDKLEFVDGTSIEGTFIGGTKTVIQFEVNGEVKEYPLEQVVSVTFAPAAQ